MEVIKEQICKTTYKGKCPICAREQTASIEGYVDIKCSRCQDKDRNIQTEQDLIGSTVINIEFDYGDIKSIILKRPDNKFVKLEIDHNWVEEPDEFCYSIFDTKEMMID